ncbi:hypothetical protein TrRE_jg9872 [Triparma retinervis]|uniref:Sirohydrochlorin cobaltochelatase n=1 Tax=Triparma retinervis TaxID=2557542 RepID=A0A9W7CIJ8_9STRA|nr:hypothetical protein TrRE_jg9872 [Triparma retinervis]
MDHGSKRVESNQRLEELAIKVDDRIKKNQLPSYAGCSHCHMELSDPSLSSVVKEVVQSEGITDFLVHPLFISPLGKHVKVDIPEIVKAASEEMKGEGVSIQMGKVFGDDLDKLVDGIVSVVAEDEEGVDSVGGLGGFQAIMDMIGQEEASG